jgi:hypothetical protein
MRRRLVLVVAPARLCASWAGDWSLSYELRSISARHADALIDQLLVVLLV